MVSLEQAHENETRLLSFLKERDIEFERFSHPVVMTVEEQAAHMPSADAAILKNLLLKDKKGRLVLVTALSSTPVDLKLLSQRLGLGKAGLRMAPLENLAAVLQVPEGSVTPLALFNESARTLPLLLDKKMEQLSAILVHPLVNDATLLLKRDAFEKFLRSVGRECNFVDLEAVVAVGKDQPPDLAHLLQGSSADSSVADSADAVAPSSQNNVQPTASGQKAEKRASAAPGVKSKAVQKGPVGDDVFACADNILRLLSINSGKQGGGEASNSSRQQSGGEASAVPSAAAAAAEAAIKEELQHLLVMFKNAAYTQGFAAARASTRT